MTPIEALKLVRIAKAACPQQAFDEYTPDAWAEILADLPFTDARTALMAVVKGQPFVSPSEIRDGVANIRKRRVAEYGPIEPPADLDPDDIDGYRKWLDDSRRAIENGERTRAEKPPLAVGAKTAEDIAHPSRWRVPEGA